MVSRDVLLVTGIEGAERCAGEVAGDLGVNVVLASTRRTALLQLRRAEFGVVMVEENLIEGDPEWADQLWESAGLAVPLQLNFSISCCARLTREIKGALSRRECEQVLARRAAAIEIANQLKSSVTGLLLQSELALQEPAMPAALQPKLQRLRELASEIRERLEREAA